MSQPTPPPRPTPPPQPASPAGEPGAQSLAAAVGEVVPLRLAEPAVTGHLWSVAAVGEGLALETDEVEPPASAAPGASRAHTWRLRATRPGRWEVVLELGRPWEAVPEERRRFVVTVG